MDLNSFFGDVDLEVNCPNCEHEFPVNFKVLSVEGSSVQCPNCHSDIVFEHDETTKKTLNDSNRAIKEFDKAFSDLEKAFKKFGK